MSITAKHSNNFIKWVKLLYRVTGNYDYSFFFGDRAVMIFGARQDEIAPITYPPHIKGIVVSVPMVGEYHGPALGFSYLALLTTPSVFVLNQDRRRGTIAQFTSSRPNKDSRFYGLTGDVLAPVLFIPMRLALFVRSEANSHHSTSSGGIYTSILDTSAGNPLRRNSVITTSQNFRFNSLTLLPAIRLTVVWCKSANLASSVKLGTLRRSLGGLMLSIAFNWLKWELKFIYIGIEPPSKILIFYYTFNEYTISWLIFYSVTRLTRNQMGYIIGVQLNKPTLSNVGSIAQSLTHTIGVTTVQAKRNSTQTAPQAQTAPIFIIPDGPCYNPEIQEWEVWIDGEVEAWAETEAQAERSYLEMLGITRKHVSRNPDNIIFINLPRETRVLVVA